MGSWWGYFVPIHEKKHHDWKTFPCIDTAIIVDDDWGLGWSKFVGYYVGWTLGT